MRSPDLELCSEKTSIRYWRIDTHGLKIEYNVNPEFIGSAVEVTGDGWLLWCIQSESNLWFQRRGEEIQAPASAFLYLPPFSIFKWRKGPGNIKIIGFGRIEEALESVTYSEPVMVINDDPFPPKSINESVSFLKKKKLPICVGLAEHSSAIARRTRELINTSYADPDFSLGKVAKILNCDQAILTRQFKRHYTIKPIDYLNTLRSQEGLRFLFYYKNEIGLTAAQVGMKSHSQFSRVFKKYIEYKPSAYLQK